MAPAVPVGGPMVQLASQKTEPDAQSAYRALQAKYPNILSGRQATIKRVEIADKGTFYRAQVGPFASADQASDFCNSLKAVGGQCIVQRN
jgi:cell division septation protein DedD